MALSSSMQWDVRTTGSDSNGGAFKSGASGTDYSQQDSPQVTYTDLVIDASLNTKVTSAATPFTSAHVGNVINVTGGTGFTTGRYEILSVASSAATLDRAVGTTSSTGGTGNLGGSMLTIQAAWTPAVSGNAIWIKSGTYTITAANTDGSSGRNMNFFGYGTTHADGGTKPLITSATNSVKSFTFVSGAICFKNIHIKSTAATRGDGLVAEGNYPELIVQDCKFEGLWKCIDNNSGNFAGVAVFNSEFKDHGFYGVAANFRCNIFACYFHGGTYVTGYDVALSNQGSVSHCVFYNTSHTGIIQNSSSLNLTNNVFHTVGTGVYMGANDGSIIVNNVFYNCGDALSTNVVGVQRYNAFRLNANNRTNVGVPDSTSGFDDITLTADPFTNPSGGDFSLNNTAGGGALLKSAGFPGAMAAGTGYTDVGAVQTFPTTLISNGSYPFVG